MTRACTECGSGRVEETILPEHTEDLGGIVVALMNSVRVHRCDGCGERETEIPDLRGLTRAVAMARALHPALLSGREVKFLRRALDMSQQEFAGAMEIRPETVSRWENEVPGTGGMTEKLVRHNVCALLHELVPAIDYQPAQIARMRLRPLEEGESLPVFQFERVIVKYDHRREAAWDERQLAA
jgi:putative zinc finger/helix-turn-helix YgiT family protein